MQGTYIVSTQNLLLLTVYAPFLGKSDEGKKISGIWNFR